MYKPIKLNNHVVGQVEIGDKKSPDRRLIDKPGY